MDIQMKKGLLEACVLASLKGGESYGYQIVKDVSKYIEVSESTLYPILKRLESGGCLATYTKEYNGRLRRYYKITQSGCEKISEFVRDWDEIARVYEYILEADGKNKLCRPPSGEEENFSQV